VSEGKYPFEDAPKNQQAFDKASAEKTEIDKQEEIIEPIDKYDEPTLEFNPPTLDHMSQSPQALGHWASNVATENAASAEQKSLEKDSSVSFANEISDNSIQSEVSLKEEWAKAVSQDNELEL
jgi:hypothetical protein